jgi:hypothetical protein
MPTTRMMPKNATARGKQRRRRRRPRPIRPRTR